MTSEQYKLLTEKERLMYDELCGATKKIVERLEVLTEVIKKAVDEANA